MVVQHLLFGGRLKPWEECLRRYILGGVATVVAITGGPARAEGCKLGVIADLPVKMEGPRATVPVQVNGKDVSFWLDSGAFFSLMSEAKAKELNLPLQSLPSGFYITGIGGKASARLATIKSFRIVGQELKNLQFLVGGSDSGSALIGLNILALADTEFDLAHGSVKLIKPMGCQKSALAYWSAGAQFFTVPLLSSPNPTDRHFIIPVSINGVELRAGLDSGASTSVISRRAAERARIDLSGPNVLTMEDMGGIGQKLKDGWAAPVDNVTIGDEQILRTRLRIIDGAIMSGSDGPDMLLGADFMLSHHIYVARSQQRVYFTYSGGKPFVAPVPDKAVVASATAAPTPIALPPDTKRVEAVNGSVEPQSASEFARRGNARMSQRRFADAIADLSEAIILEPDNPEHYKDRAQAYGMSDQSELANSDMEKALQLKPDDKDLLRTRAYLRIQSGDKTGALADADAAAKLTAPTSLDAIAVAALFEKLGQPARAIPVIDPVIASHLEDAALGNMLNLRCWVRALANVDLDKAINDCDRAIKRDGPKPAYLDSRGLARFRSGDTTGALADYDTALAQNPEIAWSLYIRGLIKISKGEEIAGRADQESALAIDPDIAKEADQYGLSK